MTFKCDDVETLYVIGWALFTLISFFAYIFGKRRTGAPGGAIYHTVSFSIYLVTLLYSAGSYGVGCLSDWERDDGQTDISLVRYLIVLVQITSFAVICAYDHNKDIFLTVVHVAMCFLCVFLWIFSALSYEENHRFFWGWSSIALSVTLALHVFLEPSQFTHSRYPAYKRLITFSVIVYTALNYVIVLWGPLYTEFVSSLAQEIILLVLDVLSSSLVFITVSHYSWAIFNHQCTMERGFSTFPGFVATFKSTGENKLLSDITVRLNTIPRTH